MRVSHETIYRSLFIQARGVLKKEILASLRSARTMRRSAPHSARSSGSGQIIDAVSIREHPAEAQDRAVPGNWEGDLLIGSVSTQIATSDHQESINVTKVVNPGSPTRAQHLQRNKTT
jgi:IS30 family transposase